MPTTHARLQRRPFLTPIWLSAFGALAGLLFCAFSVWLWSSADSTLVIVVRHAEKRLDAGGDPPLSAAGEARAALLARMFGDGSPGRLDAIYVSATERSRSTAAPLAARLGLTPRVVAQDAPRDLARKILREHPGGRILVVGHADTMVALVQALSGAKELPPIGADEYGTMYIVSVPRIGRSDFVRLTY